MNLKFKEHPIQLWWFAKHAYFSGQLALVNTCPGLVQGRLEARWLDESDCVGAWQSESMAAVVLPTAYTLDALRAIDADRGGQRLMLVFNPQWQTDGQIVSDFGCAQSCFPVLTGYGFGCPSRAPAETVPGGTDMSLWLVFEIQIQMLQP